MLSGPNLDSYYALPKKLRWLDSPWVCGGRALDVGMIAPSLFERADNALRREWAPEARAAYTEMKQCLEAAEQSIWNLMDVVNRQIAELYCVQPTEEKGCPVKHRWPCREAINWGLDDLAEHSFELTPQERVAAISRMLNILGNWGRRDQL